MKIIVILISSIVLLGAGAVCQAQNEMPESSVVLLKGDLLGVGVFFPSRQAYCWLSPELEWHPRLFNSLSMTLDLEYFKGSPPIKGSYDIWGNGQKYLVEGEIQDHNYAARLGLRKYFGAKRFNLQGVFVEGQAGLGYSKLDTVFYVSAQPVQRMRNQVGLELRLRTGYQFALSRRWWCSFSIAGDVRRMVARQSWYRCFLPEFNIGFRF